MLICIFAGAELEFRIRGGKLKKKNWKAKTKKITKFSGKIIYIYNFFFFFGGETPVFGGVRPHKARGSSVPVYSHPS